MVTCYLLGKARSFAGIDISFKAFINIFTWVDLPARSQPSKTIKAPRLLHMISHIYTSHQARYVASFLKPDLHYRDGPGVKFSVIISTCSWFSIDLIVISLLCV